MRYLICILVTCAFTFNAFGCKQTASSGAGKKISVVCAATNIRVGEEFSVLNLGRKNVDFKGQSVTALTNDGILKERRSKREIRRGEMLSLDDVMDEDKLKWTREDELSSRRASKAVSKGIRRYFKSRTEIKAGEILWTPYIDPGSVPIDSPKEKQIPDDAIQSLKEIHGMKAKQVIPEGQIITRGALEKI